jgi:hypothetical protein
MRLRETSIVFGLLIPIALQAAPAALAAGGEIELSQAAAVAGGVTPGDTAGFPITISASGRYRLVGNLDVPAGDDGIVIDADNVTLDFNGYTLDGGGKGGTGVASRSDGIEIENGGVTGFQSFGITSGAVGKFWTISGMRVVKNGLGVSAGDYARVVGNNISFNDNYGLSCEFCLVQGNVVARNHDDGIDVRGGSVVDNMIASNRGFGISAFMLGFVLSGYGNNTLINNNGSGQIGADGQFVQQSPQVNGRILPLQPNVE